MRNTDKKLSGPPEDLTNAGMLEWFKIEMGLFNAGRWDAELLPAVDKLARLKDQRNKLLDELGLEPQPESTGFQPNTKYIHLVEGKEFDKRFWHYANKCDTYQAAWKRVEWEYRQTFGKNRYSSYKSYSNTRNNRAAK